MSSGHSYGAIEAGASQYLGSRPQTEPDIRPPGPIFPLLHFFQVSMVYEQSLLELCTHPDSSFLIQHAVFLSFNLLSSISLRIFMSFLIHGANFAPRCIKSAALGPIQKLAGSE